MRQATDVPDKSQDINEASKIQDIDVASMRQATDVADKSQDTDVAQRVTTQGEMEFAPSPPHKIFLGGVELATHRWPIVNTGKRDKYIINI